MPDAVATTAERLALEYVLPLRRHDREGEDELVRYLGDLVARVDVTVVDGSERALFDALSDRLPVSVRHVRPTVGGLNGKARGAMTGVRLARHDNVVIADDDVRYGPRSLEHAARLLADADFVRLQNAYSAHPWWARWDTARSLVGRAFGGDFGGTVAVRRSVLLRAGGYSTDVLFENLELERTIRLAGGRVVVAQDVLVPRIPPTLRHFVGQRVRQAYDDFAQPARLAVELALLPIAVTAIALRAWRVLGAVAAAAVAVAEVGRRRGAARGAIPASAAVWAPAWAAERAVTAWVAVVYRVRGGMPYAGRRIYAAATPQSLLRRRLATGGRTS
ncbi:glycosyltransferase [Microbacterium sp. NPDC057407]|uniref:glycosyltransferase n=1 Tax=Microbacterium sp. NPDC057407 TaxID=3346120 RepID=UPI003671F305